MQWLAILPLLVAVWALYRTLRAARTTFFNFYSWVPPVTREVSLEEQPLPQELEKNAQILTILGFHSIGVTQTRVFPEGEGNTWWYLHPDGEIFAEMIQYRRAVAFDTWFPNDAYILTSCPFGEKIRTPMFHCRFAAGSLEAAFNYHTQQVDIWRWLHGDPVRFASIAEMLEYEPVYRRLYRIRHMRRLTITTALMTLAWLGIALSSGVFTVMFTQISPDQFLEMMLALLAAYVVCFSALAYLGNTITSPPGALDREGKGKKREEFL
jgi:hypothetical protein